MSYIQSVWKESTKLWITRCSKVSCFLSTVRVFLYCANSAPTWNQELSHARRRKKIRVRVIIRASQVTFLRYAHRRIIPTSHYPFHHPTLPLRHPTHSPNSRTPTNKPQQVPPQVAPLRWGTRNAEGPGRNWGRKTGAETSSRGGLDRRREMVMEPSCWRSPGGAQVPKGDVRSKHDADAGGP